MELVKVSSAWLWCCCSLSAESLCYNITGSVQQRLCHCVKTINKRLCVRTDPKSLLKNYETLKQITRWVGLLAFSRNSVVVGPSPTKSEVNLNGTVASRICQSNRVMSWTDSSDSKTKTFKHFFSRFSFWEFNFFFLCFKSRNRTNSTVWPVQLHR